MPHANLKIDIGKDAGDYIEMMGKEFHYNRSDVKIHGRGNLIEIEVSARDPRALLGSINSTIKRLRIMGGADNLVTRLSKARGKAH